MVWLNFTVAGIALCGIVGTWLTIAQCRSLRSDLKMQIERRESAERYSSRLRIASKINADFYEDCVKCYEAKLTECNRKICRLEKNLYEKNAELIAEKARNTK